MNPAQRCPGCGRANGCAQAGRDTAVQDCWCFHVPLPPAALDEQPEARRNAACLCPDCLRALGARARPA
ncbi:cysteine-rich CWC family protein [Pseudomonas sp. CAU 1711]|uniref:cysteine-rich CWC family protein n=1 Tax=Pseudomonas sp. CAU 1711 TaxID=3140356 RepID=UPI00326067FF